MQLPYLRRVVVVCIAGSGSPRVRKQRGRGYRYRGGNSRTHIGGPLLPWRCAVVTAEPLVWEASTWVGLRGMFTEAPAVVVVLVAVLRVAVFCMSLFDPLR